jgi:glycosyltransferase involved in cell wall biosynthesis
VPDDYCKASREEARQSLGLAKEERLVVWVGNLVSVKDPALAIEAFSLSARRIPNLRLALIGSGPLEHKLQAAIRNSSRPEAIWLVGALDPSRVALWQAAADVALNTSRSEGLGIALIEALLVGTRVVVPPVGEMPELVRSTVGGTITESRTPEAIAAAIEYELELPCDDGVASRAGFLRLSNIAAQIEAVYARLLAS